MTYSDNTEKALSYEEVLRERIAKHYSLQKDFMSESEFKSFVEFRLVNETHQEQWIKTLDVLTGSLNGKDILDVGCGDGGFVVALKNYSYSSSVKGCDLSADNVEMAQLRGEKYGIDPGVFTACDDVKLPFPDNSFDVVVMFDVLEHVSHISEVLSEVSRVLRSGGCFFSSTPNFLWPKESHLRMWFVHWMPEKIRDMYVRKRRNQKAVELIAGINLLNPYKISPLFDQFFSHNILNDEIFLTKINSLGTKSSSILISHAKKIIRSGPVWFWFRYILRYFWPSTYIFSLK